MKKIITTVFFVATAIVFFISLGRGYNVANDRADAYFLSGISGRPLNECTSGLFDSCVQSYATGRYVRTMVVAENPTERIVAFDALTGFTSYIETEKVLLRRQIRDELRSRKAELGTIFELRSLRDGVDTRKLLRRNSDAIYEVLYQNRPLNVEIPPPFPVWLYFGKCMIWLYGLSSLIACFCFLSPQNPFKMPRGFDLFFTILFFPTWFVGMMISTVFYAPVWILRFLAKKHLPAERKVETVSFGQPPFRTGEAEVLPGKEPWKTALWRWICRRVAKPEPTV